MLIRLFTLKLPYPIEVCTMKQLIDGGRAGGLIPTHVNANDVPDASVLNIINACLDTDPKERPTFKIIEETFSIALKRCRDAGGSTEGRSSGELYQGKLPSIKEKHEDSEYETKR